MPEIHLYNSEKRRKELFQPLFLNKVLYYTCGPTVYHYAHIGNFRTFVFEDIVKRAFSFFGYDIKHVMNLTDVDDKTIRGALKEKKSLEEYTAFYKKAFFDDLKELHILPADEYPEATKYIQEIIEAIQTLYDKGIAYQGPDKSIYFSVSAFESYGKLSNITLEGNRSEAVAHDEYSKENVADFALWKQYDDERDGSIYWESPFGKGRPGWHIECSVMAQTLLNETIDIHAGGVDLIFPHHENEIAQAEAITGKPFVNYWLHAEHLLVDGQKMSKSLGNFYTLRDLMEKGYSGREVRFLFLSAHYRQQYNFTLHGLDAAKSSLKRLDDCLFRLESYHPSEKEHSKKAYLEEVLDRFSASLADDINVTGAIGVLFDFVRDINSFIDKKELSEEDIEGVYSLLKKMDSVLGVLHFDKAAIPPECEKLLKERSEARKAKDWARADAIRDELKALGFVVEDTPEGPLLKPIAS